MPEKQALKMKDGRIYYQDQLVKALMLTGWDIRINIYLRHTNLGLQGLVEKQVKRRVNRWKHLWDVEKTFSSTLIIKQFLNTGVTTHVRRYVITTDGKRHLYNKTDLAD